MSVLIVPYGIETTLQQDYWRCSNCLNCTLWNWNLLAYWDIFKNYYVLIVPYGIETILVLRFLLSTLVLIVPYGIETWFAQGPCNYDQVLIVPYGIETARWRSFSARWAGLNCTLWNWNSLSTSFPCHRGCVISKF